MDVSIVVASIAGTVALASAMLATTQATKARKSGRTEQLEAKLDQLTADRHLLYLWNRQLVYHIYLSIAPLIALWQPEIATAIRDGANIFGATALGTAALNTPQRTPTTSGRHLAPPPQPSQQPPPPKAW